ncbi:MAG: hypothetical protein LBB21_04115 [Holosporaceae bacterium]|jgi:hypothetical protein|nr:hypothetical protein [Holosporaceae bacterium]
MKNKNDSVMLEIDDKNLKLEINQRENIKKEKRFWKGLLAAGIGIAMLTGTSEARWHPVYMKGVISIFKGEYQEHARHAAHLLYTKAGNKKILQYIDKSNSVLKKNWEDIFNKDLLTVKTVISKLQGRKNILLDAEKVKNLKKEAKAGTITSDSELGKLLNLKKKRNFTEKELKQRLDNIQIETELSQVRESLKAVCMYELVKYLFPSTTGELQAVTDNSENLAKVISSKYKLAGDNSYYQEFCHILNNFKIGTALPQSEKPELKKLTEILELCSKNDCNKDEIIQIVTAFFLEIADDAGAIVANATEADFLEISDDRLGEWVNGTFILGYDKYVNPTDSNELVDLATIMVTTAEDVKTDAETSIRKDFCLVKDDDITFVFSPYNGRPTSQSSIPFSKIVENATNPTNTFADCVETSLRHTASILLLKKDTDGKFGFDTNVLQEKVKDFFEKHGDALSASTSNEIDLYADWDKMLASSGHTQIQYRKEITTKDNQTYKVEMASGMKNFARGLIEIFKLDENEFDVSKIEKTKESMENFYEKMFNAINPTKKYFINITNFKEAFDDFEGNVEVTLRYNEEKDLAKFTIFMKRKEKSGHTEANNCQTFTQNY